jgi:hypothetical protein
MIGTGFGTVAEKVDICRNGDTHWQTAMSEAIMRSPNYLGAKGRT